LANHLLAVATDDSCLEALARALRRRYEPDFAVDVAHRLDEGLHRIQALRDAGEQVALVVAPFRMEDSAGIAFLTATHEVFPSALCGGHLPAPGLP
jgi:thioredoxin reductase (NADPH)